MADVTISRIATTVDTERCEPDCSGAIRSYCCVLRLRAVSRRWPNKNNTLDNLVVPFGLLLQLVV
jgi:hypothetical protein